MSETIRLTVTGMTCGGCEQAVTRALHTLPGVERVAASHRDNEVTVTFDPARVAVPAIRDKVGLLGYTVAP
jgi:copper chaperone CopZ